MADATIDDVFENLSLAAFEVGGAKFAFPCISCTQTGGNRIIPRERPYRDGAKLDDTGSQAKQWVLRGIFNNMVGTLEPGIAAVNGDSPLYPDVLSSMIRMFDTHETGIVTVPREGEQPARAVSYTVEETAEERSTAIVTFTFLEDNEDSVDFERLVEEPTVSANAKYAAAVTTFSFQSDGNWDQFIADLETLSNQMEDLANSPQSIKSDLDASHERLKQTHAKVLSIGRDNSIPGKGNLRGPGGNASERKMALMLGMSARATNDARKGRPQVVTVITSRTTTLAGVAADTGQDYIDLMEINPELNPFLVPEGSRVKIYANDGNVR